MTSLYKKKLKPIKKKFRLEKPPSELELWIVLYDTPLTQNVQFQPSPAIKLKQSFYLLFSVKLVVQFTHCVHKWPRSEGQPL